jgi:hypothetical protein
MAKKVINKVKTKYTEIIYYKDGTTKINKLIDRIVNLPDKVMTIYKDGSIKNKYNKPGRPKGSKNKIKPPTNKQLDMFWLMCYNKDNTCVICENTGVIDTIAVNGRINMCICPIGREMMNKDENFLQNYIDHNYNTNKK